MTRLGGSRILPQALEAMVAVSQEFVDLNALLDAAGARVACLTRAPAACICAGAAAGITLATAGCMTGSDPERVRRLPDTRGMRCEVVLDGAQDNPFVHAVLHTGARPVRAGSRSSPMRGSELEAALSGRTAAVMYFVAYASAGGLPLEQVIATAHAAGVPAIVDAAAQLPPVDNLWRYTEMGADMVIFSGGKDIRGPQASGFILGQPDLVQACRLNGSPNEETICRGMKISKEGIVGLVVALEHYLQRDFAAEMAGYERLVARMGAMLAGAAGLTAYRVCPGPADIQPNIIPRLFVDPDPALGASGEDLACRLWQGDPPIAVAMSPTGIIINPQMLTDDEALTIARRLRGEAAARAG